MLGSALLIAGCATHAPDAQKPLGELPAHYTGTLPCADCPGIDESLTLTADHQYVLQEHYRHTNPSDDFVEIGQWRVNTPRSTLILTPSNSDDGATKQWRIDAPDRVTALNDQGQTFDAPFNLSLGRVTPPVDTPLTGTRWIMTHTAGQSIPHNAYIKLESGGSRVVGSTGCNRVMGEYSHQADRQLMFQRLASTRMACGAVAGTEQAFLEALGRTRRARVIGYYLLLYGQATDPAPLAIFRQDP